MKTAVIIFAIVGVAWFTGEVLDAIKTRAYIRNTEICAARYAVPIQSAGKWICIDKGVVR